MLPELREIKFFIFFMGATCLAWLISGSSGWRLRSVDEVMRIMPGNARELVRGKHPHSIHAAIWKCSDANLVADFWMMDGKLN